MKERDEFLQLLDRLKDEMSLNDVQAGEILEVGGTYLSQIRTGAKSPGPKLIRRIKQVLLEPPGILREKALGYRISSHWLSVFGDVVKTRVEEWAAEADIHPQEFVAKVLLDYGRQTRDDLLKKKVNSSPEEKLFSQLVENEIEAVKKETTESKPPTAPGDPPGAGSPPHSKSKV